MYLDGIGEIGDQASEGQAAGLYAAGFFSRVSDRGKFRIDVSFDKKLTEV